jgi:guanosine-3',5'-bis(diphosphate) 3'-pyrophosphohydrolase
MNAETKKPTLLDSATIIAATAHGGVGQRRKWTNEPYIVHPLEVVGILMQHGITDEVLLAAAVLHDVIEDCGWTDTSLLCALSRVTTLLNAIEITDLVVELTEPAHEGNRATRKAAEAMRLSKISADAQTIKYADLISNTRTIIEHDKGFATVYLAEKEAILRVMCDGDESLNVTGWSSLNAAHFALKLS